MSITLKQSISPYTLIHFKHGDEVCIAEYELDDDEVIVYEFYPNCSKNDYWDVITEREQKSVTESVYAQVLKDAGDEAQTAPDSIRDDYLDKRIPNSHFIGSI